MYFLADSSYLPNVHSLTSCMADILVSFSREAERDIQKEREIYFKELAHVTVGAGKSETHRADQQTGNSGKVSGGRADSSQENLGFGFIAFN